jgi:hypothetical protein
MEVGVTRWFGAARWPDFTFLTVLLREFAELQAAFLLIPEFRKFSGHIVETLPKLPRVQFPITTPHASLRWGHKPANF